MGIQITMAKTTKHLKMLTVDHECCWSLQAKTFINYAHAYAFSALSASHKNSYASPYIISFFENMMAYYATRLVYHTSS